MKKLIKMYNEKFGDTLGVIDDDFNKEQMYRIYYFIKNNCDDKDIQERLEKIKLDKPKTLEQQLTKLEGEHNKVSGEVVDPTIKNDINDIKTDLGTSELNTTAKDIKGAINEVNAQYKDIVQNKGNSCLGIHINNFPRLPNETNDSPRIQRAFNSLSNKNIDSDGYYKGLMIYFPSGIYEIATTVTGTNVGMIGDTGTIFKGIGTGFMFDISFDGELGFAHVSGGAPVYQWRNFPIEKCIFNGNGTMNGVKHTAGHNISLRDCIFCDTVDYGYYIASGSKYMLDHVSFRGITDNTAINKLAIYLGGSDHNVNNIICANYTKMIDVNAANSIFSQCHHWLNHNDRIPSSIMYDINAGGCIFTDSYLDTVKIGFNINKSEQMIKGIIGYNNPTFNLTGATYIKNNINNASISVFGVNINDSRNGTFWNGDKNSPNIKVLGINGNCINIFETYGTAGSNTPVACTGVSLDRSALSIDANTSTTATLTPIVTPTNTTDKIIWSVSPSGIVTISNGIIRAKANGECIVTVSCGHYSANCTVTVNNVNESAKTWDLEWNSTDGKMNTSDFTVGDAIDYSTENYLQSKRSAATGDSQKIYLTNFTGGNQEFEIEFRSAKQFDSGSYIQLGAMDTSGNGLKIYSKSSTELQIKNYTDSYPTYTQGEWTKLKVKQENGKCTFYVNDLTVASNLSTISDSYNFQGVQISGDPGLIQIRAVRLKQL